VQNYSCGNLGAGIISTTMAGGSMAFLLFNEYLAVDKIKRYKKLKNILNKRGWNKRIIDSMSHTWCERNLIQLVSDDSGFGEKTRNYLYQKGYEWYHFFPEI